jgi:flagellar biosynthesis/type III secretory pathway protein FliH
VKRFKKKEGRKEGSKEGRKQGRKEGSKEGRKEREALAHTHCLLFIYNGTKIQQMNTSSLRKFGTMEKNQK